MFIPNHLWAQADAGLQTTTLIARLNFLDLQGCWDFQEHEKEKTEILTSLWWPATVTYGRGKLQLQLTHKAVTNTLNCGVLATLHLPSASVLKTSENVP